MKIREINESKYSNAGGNRLAEERFVVYDLRTKSFIQKNYKNQTGISRRGSITSGVTWFKTFERAEEFINELQKQLSSKRYEEGSKYIQRGNYRYDDQTIILTAAQARSKNKMMDKRQAEIGGLVISTIRATY